MEFNNYTPFAGIGWEAIDANENWSSIILARVKFDLNPTPKVGELELSFSKDQGELFSKDTYYGELGNSSVQYESDYVIYKENTDVIINANAISPKNKKRKTWDCGIRIYAENKKLLKEYGLKVQGEKRSYKVGLVWTPAFRRKAKSIPIRYEKASGGTIKIPAKNEKKKDKYLKVDYYNPIGCGFKKIRDPKRTVHAPQIKYLYKKVKNIPAGFGFIGRAWKSRLKYVGTYDQKWLDEQHPLPPHDFDMKHNQAAHPELIMDGYLKAGTKIELFNLLEGEEKYTFTLPKVDLISKISVHTGEIYKRMNLDTLIIDINSEDEKEHCIYASYRIKIEKNQEIDLAELMLIPEQKEKEIKNG